MKVGGEVSGEATPQASGPATISDPVGTRIPVERDVVELSEEERGLSLAERRAIARRKAREAQRDAAEGENA